MMAERVGKDTLLARIVQMVSEAQRTRAPIQRMADTISSYFVPAVIAIAFLTLVVWWLIGPAPSAIYGLVNAVSVLIIACPCALGLATPMSITVGMGRGSEMGVLIKNADSLEKLGMINTLVVDKTGTLSEGRPRLTQVTVDKEWQEYDVLALAASLEQYSEHPIASAIVSGASERSISLSPVSNFRSTPGGGVEGVINGQHIVIGKLSFLQEHGVVDDGTLVQPSLEPGSSVFVGINGHCIGTLTITDPIKAAAPQAIEALHEMDIKVIMLSGDNIQTAEAVAKLLHIDDFRGGVDPAYKKEFVIALQKGSGWVAMAGDGINDAPALAAADVGIAMGNGTDVAIESADVTLVKGDITGIVRAIRLSRAVIANIRENLLFAFFYNILGVTVATGILYPLIGLLLNPMVAALAMSLSSVSVIFNSLRLQNKSLH